MAISTQKLLPGGSTGGAITPIRSSAITPIRSSAITQIKPVIGSSSEKTPDKKILKVKIKVIEVDKLLKGSVVNEKKRIDDKKRKEQQETRSKREDELEKKPEGGEKKKSGLKAPKISFFDRIKNFIKNVLLGFILVRLVEFAPILNKIAPIIGGVVEFVSNVFMGIIDGLGTFLKWGFDAWESSEKKLKEWGGDEAVARFNDLGNALENLFNAIAIVGMTTVALRGKPGTKPGTKPGVKPGTKPGTPTRPSGRPGMGPTGPRGASRAIQLRHGHEARAIYDNARANGKSVAQAKAAVNRSLRSGQIISKPQTGSLKPGSPGTPKGSIMKRGLSKAPGRLATKLLGKGALQSVKGIFGRIPILGPIVVAVSSLLAGEPVGQALFKGLGAAVGGFLGTFIPIPVIGTMLGEVLGTFVGDLLYSLILGGGPKEAGEKLSKAIKTALDVGGLIVNFFKEGLQRFTNGFFEKHFFTIPDFGGVRTAATAMAEAMGAYNFLRDRGYAEGNKPPFSDKKQISKFPNFLQLYNPLAIIPLLGSSFFPALFGKTSQENPKQTNNDAVTQQSSSGSGNQPGPSGQGVQQMSSQGKAGMDISGKGSAIYLHWTAGNYNSIYGPYHTVFTGDGTMHRKFEYNKSTGGHTYNRNGGGSVGLSLAANPDIGQWPTEAQRVAMAKEAARIAKAWGWSKNDISTKKVMTHGEAGSNIDGYNAHTNYGPFGRGRSDTHKSKDKASVGRVAPVERWDLDKLNSHKDIYGSGGDEMRNRIKGFMRMGGRTKGKGLYYMGEEGTEFVLDADSTAAIEGAYPGLLNAATKAKGTKAIEVLKSYAEYEMPEVIPVPIIQPVPVGGGSYDTPQKSPTISGGGSKRKDPFQEILYMR